MRKMIKNPQKRFAYMLGGLVVLIATASSAFPCFWLLGQPRVPDELRIDIE